MQMRNPQGFFILLECRVFDQTFRSRPQPRLIPPPPQKAENPAKNAFFWDSHGSITEETRVALNLVPRFRIPISIFDRFDFFLLSSSVSEIRRKPELMKPLKPGLVRGFTSLLSDLLSPRDYEESCVCFD